MWCPRRRWWKPISGRNSMLSVSNLSVWYVVTEVLRDVTFEVPEGKVVALLGGNGSGKTTILNTLTGLIRPRGGSISIAGEEIAGRPPDRIVKLGMAQVPQGREVFASMTVEENIDLGAVTRRDRKVVASDKVAIGRALMCRPRLLLMDEPSAGLAPVIVETMIETIRTLHARGLTILLVEQNVGVAAAVAESAHVLQNGEIVYRGPAKELISSREVLASYLGR